MPVEIPSNADPVVQNLCNFCNGKFDIVEVGEDYFIFSFDYCETFFIHMMVTLAHKRLVYFVRLVEKEKVPAEIHKQFMESFDDAEQVFIPGPTTDENGIEFVALRADFEVHEDEAEFAKNRKKLMLGVIELTERLRALPPEFINSMRQSKRS
ncbi:MAG: hypothetical protein L6Q98_16785 [Anaerolineae bacterium]|nr:hypothetical protein [Anaerolineae bacterium]NUQ03905.1 hypothetical protein [Anaerolineae bacterium]